MDILDQVKTPQGRVPVCDACVTGRPEAQGGNDSFSGSEPCFRFTLASPNDVAADARLRRLDATLEDVAFIDSASLLDVARGIGPLFGASCTESLQDWQSAAEVARATVMMQEVVNGAKPLSMLRGADSTEGFGGLVAKTLVGGGRDGGRGGNGSDSADGFAMYALSFPVDARREGGYVSALPRMPWFRKFASEEDGFNYVFANIDDYQEDGAFLSIVLLSFKREITSADFVAMLLCFCENGEQAQSVMASIARERFEAIDVPEGQDAFGLLEREGMPVAIEAELAEEDVPQLAKLVQGIVSLHLQGATVDLFRASEEDGFLAFDSALAYLWYGFARKLGQIRVGYCQQCGKPFSLAGHRGIPKRFCSDTCKTKAKNERQRKLVQEVRNRFVAGESVDAIVRACYPGEAHGVAAKKVRVLLHRWVQLRHMVEEGVALGDEALANRCVGEGVCTLEEVDMVRRRCAAKNKSPKPLQ